MSLAQHRSPSRELQRLRLRARAESKDLRGQTPSYYTESEGGSWIPWDLGAVVSVDADGYGESAMRDRRLVNGLVVHSLLFGEWEDIPDWPTQRWGQDVRRWDAWNGWTHPSRPMLPVLAGHLY